MLSQFSTKGLGIFYLRSSACLDSKSLWMGGCSATKGLSYFRYFGLPMTSCDHP